MKNRLVDKNVFIFLSKGKDDTYFCRSFFPEVNRDYTKNQASWTLLYKEKIKRSTGQKTFYLPVRELTDEELLQIIDFRKKAYYSMERIREEIRLGYRQEFPKQM